MLEETALTSESMKGGLKMPPLSLIEERKDFEVSLKLAGMSITSIVKQVNIQATIKRWGEVSRQMVERDIADHFRKNRVLTIQDHDHLENMRSVLLEQIELNIERMALHIANKKDWKAFEKQDAIEKLHKMHCSYAEIQNWNLGRKNPLVAFQQNNINNVYDIASADLQNVKTESMNKMINYIDGYIEELKGEYDKREKTEEELIDL